MPCCEAKAELPSARQHAARPAARFPVKARMLAGDQFEGFLAQEGMQNPAATG